MSNTKKTKKRYDRFSAIYDSLEYPLERKIFKHIRKETLSHLSGKILEIGVGTGKNLEYYNENAIVTAIDFSPKMLNKATRKKSKGKLLLMDAQDLKKFKDMSFDYVVGTFVLCSIPDPIKALKECKRVVKPSGKVIFVEHVLSEKKIISFFQHLHNPITSTLFGFNVNRDTKKNIQKSGLQLKKDELVGFFDVLRRFSCAK